MACKIDENPAGIKACRCAWQLLLFFGAISGGGASCSLLQDVHGQYVQPAMGLVQALGLLLGRGSVMPLKHSRHTVCVSYL